jgi:HEPN domain-containing protein
MSVPEEWVERARYDIGTAKDMLAAGRYLYVLFCCQQAVEKALKAIIAQRTNEMPPRLHNLIDLTEKAGLQVDESRSDKLGLLTKYYIESRYPDELEALSRGVDDRFAREVYRDTEVLLRWLFGLMKQ